MNGGSVEVQIWRQDGPLSTPGLERHRVPRSLGTVVDALEWLARQPRDADGVARTPVAYAGCSRAPGCGLCVMVINGWPRPACATPLSSLGPLAALEPLPRFPVIRDLWVDRDEVDRTAVDMSPPLTAAPPEPPAADRQTTALLQRLQGCHHCGLCLEVCPAAQGAFVGAGAVHQIRVGALTAMRPGPDVRALERLAQADGVAACDATGNCERACPLRLPLVASLSRVERAVAQVVLGRRDV